MVLETENKLHGNLKKTTTGDFNARREKSPLTVKSAVLCRPTQKDFLHKSPTGRKRDIYDVIDVIYDVISK